MHLRARWLGELGNTRVHKYQEEPFHAYFLRLSHPTIQFAYHTPYNTPSLPTKDEIRGTEQKQEV